MGFTPKDWENDPNTSTPISAAALQDLEARLAAYADLLVPIGSLKGWAGAGDPAGGAWLLCDGRAISRTTYADLWAALSTTYGSGNGSTTFNIPDLRGRVSVGPDNMGTAQGAASRLTANNARGNASGSERHTLAANESGVKAHGHGRSGGVSATTSTGGEHAHPSPNGQFVCYRGDDFGYELKLADGNSYPSNLHFAVLEGATGGMGSHGHGISVSDTIGVSNHAGEVAGAAHNNMEPYQVANAIIRAI